MGKTLVPRMHSLFVEDGKDGRKAYKSLLLEPSKLSVLNSEMAVEIVRELTRQPSCALDIARSLQKDEQKIYYYLRKLEASGIVRLAGMERRHGMTAKIYEAIAPVIATKLHDDGHMIRNDSHFVNTNTVNFFTPFVQGGAFNAKIVIGDPNQHGRFDARSKEGSYIADLALLMGTLVENPLFPAYTIDTEISESQLKDNLILIGNSRTNTVLERYKDFLPITFLEGGEYSIVSKRSGKVYTDPRTGFIVKAASPVDKDKKILVVGGIRTRGLRAAIVALTQQTDRLSAGNGDGAEFVAIVKGLDKQGNGVIDSAEFLE